METVQRKQQQTDMAEADLEVCEALKIGKCPHGISGRTLVNGVSCSKAHPKRCQKFTRFGTNAKKGCTLGSNCEHYHTQHCKSSQKNRQCFNEKCTLVHLAGTKRSKLPANPKSDSNNTNLTEQKKPGRNRLKSGSEMAKTYSDHFLEMKTLLESMQEKFQKELKSLQEQITYQASKISSLVPGIMSDDTKSNNQPHNAQSSKSCEDSTMWLYSSIISLNMQSLNLSARSQSKWKLPHFRKMVQKGTHSHAEPFIALTETWYITDSQIELKHYNVHKCDRNSRIGSGVLLYTHESIPITEFDKFDNQTCQMLICKWETYRMIICILYRPPEAPLISFKPVLIITTSVFLAISIFHALIGILSQISQVQQASPYSAWKPSLTSWLNIF